MAYRVPNFRVQRFVLLVTALLGLLYLRVQHDSVPSSHEDDGTPIMSRKLSQRPVEDPVTSLVGAQAPVHGYVRKAGMTALANWHPAFANLRKTQFKAWQSSKGSLIEGNSAAGMNLLGTKPPFVLPFHDGRGCNIYYNERYKVIYLRTQKVASTTTMTFFGECANEPDRPTCLKPLDVEDSLQLQLMWRNFFVFGWSRNPWLRAVSSYQYLLHAVKDVPECDRINWDAFCQDPLVFGDLCKAQPDCCPHFNHIFMNFHVNDQTTCLLTDSGEWAADFIGRSERFDQDFAIIVAAINQRLSPGVDPLSIQSKPVSQNTNEVECSDEFQPRSRQRNPAGGTSAQGGSQATAQAGAGGGNADVAAAMQATGASGAQAQQGIVGSAAAGSNAEAAAAGAGQQQGDQQAAAVATQQQQQQAEQQQQVLQQGGGGSKRRLLYGRLPGFLFAEENYCDKRRFYTDRHAPCFQQVARFYGGDVQRLGFGRLLVGDEQAEPQAPVLSTH